MDFSLEKLATCLSINNQSDAQLKETEALISQVRL